MRILVLVTLLCACPGKDKESKDPPPPPPKVSDAAVAADWTESCAEALVTKMSPVRKLGAVIDGCQPCGDWNVLLAWNTPMVEGGPPEAKIEEAMIACKAYCTGDSKMQFMGTLDDARGKTSNRPWRALGEKCKEAVSAVPDVRFMSAPYFALDRIARAAAADPKLAPLLAALELPLPAVSMTGVGFELPTAAVMKPEPGKFHVTVSLNELRIGTLPTAKLGANGVTVELGATPYPGELVAEKDLAQKLDALTGSATARVLVIAPTGLLASRVGTTVAAAGKHELVLAVAASGGPRGWELPGVVPVLLDAAPDPKSTEWKLDKFVDKQMADLKAKPATAFERPRITIAADANVAMLATLLGGLAFRDAKSASLVNDRKRP